MAENRAARASLQTNGQSRLPRAEARADANQPRVVKQRRWSGAGSDNKEEGGCLPGLGLEGCARSGADGQRFERRGELKKLQAALSVSECHSLTCVPVLDLEVEAFVDRDGGGSKQERSHGRMYTVFLMLGLSVYRTV
jgi:hypothetical protein